MLRRTLCPCTPKIPPPGRPCLAVCNPRWTPKPPSQPLSYLGDSQGSFVPRPVCLEAPVTTARLPNPIPKEGGQLAGLWAPRRPPGGCPQPRAMLTEYKRTRGPQSPQPLNGGGVVFRPGDRGGHSALCLSRTWSGGGGLHFLFLGDTQAPCTFAAHKPAGPSAESVLARESGTDRQTVTDGHTWVSVSFMVTPRGAGLCPACPARVRLPPDGARPGAGALHRLTPEGS